MANTSTSLTTHVLDTSRGRPAAGLDVELERFVDPAGWSVLGRARTDGDGRVKVGLAPPAGLLPGTYRLRFATGAWFEAQGIEAFHPTVEITFVARGDLPHLHVPLLLGPWSYTTYRGS